MEPRPPRHAAPSTVGDRLRLAWAAERSLDASTLDAVEQHGRLVLTGDVGSHSDRVTAVALAEHWASAIPLDDRIVVRGYECDPAESDDAVRQRVRRAIAAASAGDGVEVRVVDHVVTLDGSVRTGAQRRAVHAAASRCPGVHFVVDHLVIG